MRIISLKESQTGSDGSLLVIEVDIVEGYENGNETKGGLIEFLQVVVL